MLKSILEYNIDYHNEHQYKKLNESFIFGVSYLTLTVIPMIMFVLWVFIKYILGIYSVRQDVQKRRKELPKLSQSLQEMVKDSTTKVYQIKDKEPNAYVIGNDNACYITTSLYNMLSEKECLAIVLHEYGHYYRNHIIKQAGVEMTTGVLAVAAFQVASLYFFGFFTPFIFLFGGFVSKKMTLIVSRSQEYDADAYVKELGYHKELVSALKKLEKWVRKELCEDLKKSECEETLKILSDNSTHPTFKDRIQKLLEKPIVKKFMFVTAMSNFSPIQFFDKLKKLIMA